MDEGTAGLLVALVILFALLTLGVRPARRRRRRRGRGAVRTRVTDTPLRVKRLP